MKFCLIWESEKAQRSGLLRIVASDIKRQSLQTCRLQPPSQESVLWKKAVKLASSSFLCLVSTSKYWKATYLIVPIDIFLQPNQIDVRNIVFNATTSRSCMTKKMSSLTTAPETRIYKSVGASFWRITSSLGGKYSASISETFFKTLIALVSSEVPENFSWVSLARKEKRKGKKKRQMKHTSWKRKSWETPWKR